MKFRSKARALTSLWCMLGLCSLGFSQSEQIKHGAAKTEDSPRARFLIIESEDLGMAHSIDKASFDALERGWITSAGFLVPAPWFPEVVRWAKIHSDIDFGLQLDLNAEWASFRWRSVSSQL
jgi:hypothetical protein